MREPHIGEKFRALVELVVTAWVFAWLLALPVPRVFSTRLYFALAVSIAAGLLIFCWDVFIASVARKQDSMPKTCYLLGGAVVIVPAVIWSLFHDPLFSTRGYVLFGVASILGFICRKLAYPQLTEEQANACEPPMTLFPKQNSVLADSQPPNL